MLVSFSVENFRSIRDMQTLSMEANRADSHLDYANCFEVGKHQLVKSAAIYGPNASGKSNIVKALDWFVTFVKHSAPRGQAGDKIDIDRFRLSDKTVNAPAFFEIQFYHKGLLYRYGFTVTTKQVEAEWLFRKKPGAKEAKLFTREEQEIIVSKDNFKEAKGLEKRTRENALFLSLCAQLDESTSKTIVQVLAGGLIYESGESKSDAGDTISALMLVEGSRTEELIPLFIQADLQIKRIVAETQGHLKTLATIFPQASKIKIKTEHQAFDSKDQSKDQLVEFDIEDESLGTQQYFRLTGLVTFALAIGGILIIDELEAHLHPLLTQKIVDLFHSPVNKKNAQLIFTSHDVTLLDSDRFRRDQIWFCEKGEQGQTELFSLKEFDPKQVRNNSKFSKQYMLGLFGAVPKLDGLEEVLNASQT